MNQHKRAEQTYEGYSWIVEAYLLDLAPVGLLRQLRVHLPDLDGAQSEDVSQL